MNYEINTQILIDAPVDKVWQLLLNCKDYPKWNPFIKSMKGKIEVGETIEVCIAPPGGSEMKFKPKVLVCKENEELQWLGKLFFKGVFDGAHRFKLTDKGNGTTLFEHSEAFHGWLVPLFKAQLETKTLAGFQQMNEALKALAEGSEPFKGSEPYFSSVKV